MQQTPSQPLKPAQQREAESRWARAGAPGARGRAGNFRGGSVGVLGSAQGGGGATCDASPPSCLDARRQQHDVWRTRATAQIAAFCRCWWSSELNLFAAQPRVSRRSRDFLGVFTTNSNKLQSKITQNTKETPRLPSPPIHFPIKWFCPHLIQPVSTSQAQHSLLRPLLIRSIASQKPPPA